MVTISALARHGWLPRNLDDVKDWLDLAEQGFERRVRTDSRSGVADMHRGGGFDEHIGELEAVPTATVVGRELAGDGDRWYPGQQSESWMGQQLVGQG